MCQEALFELKYLLNLMKDEVKASQFFSCCSDLLKEVL